MKICFAGLENQIVLSGEHVSVLQIDNKALFCRICQALLSCKGAKAIEPYSVWEKDEEVAPAKAFIVVRDPFALPLGHRSLSGKLFSIISQELLLDEDSRFGIQQASAELNSLISRVGLQFNADYSFEIEWVDEATSSIDTRTERIVQAGMDALMHGRTVFVIAHRLSTIQNSDVIMVLDHGRIIERGSHEKLMEEKGRYYLLYTGMQQNA